MLFRGIANVNASAAVASIAAVVYAVAAAAAASPAAVAVAYIISTHCIYTMAHLFTRGPLKQYAE